MADSTIAATLDGVSEPDVRPLLEAWEGILYEGNRRGVLAGTGGNGQPLKPVTYRLGLRSAVPRVRMRASLRLTRRVVSSRDYLHASGPPLAPFGESSRVISNFATRAVQYGYEYYVECGWIDVLSKPTKNRPAEPFLKWHFRSENAAVAKLARFPRRDLRGVRPATAKLLAEARDRWIRQLVKRGT